MNYDIVVDERVGLPLDYYNGVKLNSIFNGKGEKVILEEETIRNYLRLKEELQKRNISIDLVKGLNFPEEALASFQDYIEKNGNEYLTGLLFDVEIKDDPKIVNGILKSILEDYGFILKRQEGNIYTIRQVSMYASKKINQYGISLEEYNKWNNFELLNYDKYHKRLENIINNAKNRVTIHESIAKTNCGFDVEHYSIGNGPHHIVVVGGTHGCEIIGVDFVTKLMEEISLGRGEYKDIDLNYFTFDFFPLHNPEGFIISTSAVDTLIKDSMTGEEKEAKCKEYYLAFRQDDINSIRKEHQDEPKLHHKMFENVTWECIPEKYKQLRENVKMMYEYYKFPNGSIIDWRSNGSGVELNANTPDNQRFERVKNGEIEYGSLRYNTICQSFPGPMGVPSKDPINFKFEPENFSLFEFIANLHAKEEYYGMFTYHGTAGAIVYKPYNFSDFDYLYAESGKLKERNYSEQINSMVANSYQIDTTYKTSGLSMVDNVGLSGCGDLLRSVYPGVILVELSKMGGNSIAPYGDIFGNYRNVINNNLKAFASSLKTIQSLERLMYDSYFEDVSKKRK